MDDHWHKLKFDDKDHAKSMRASMGSFSIYNWLKSEIGYDNYDFDRENLYFKHEEDKVKFILRWL